MKNKVDFNKSFYNEHWRHGWKARFMYDPISKKNIAQYLFKQIGFKDGDKAVLDIGFGFGIILFTFAKTDSISGIELAESAVCFAREQAKKQGYKKAFFITFEGEGRLSLPDSTYDLVICSHVLEHVPEDNFILEEIKRVLKPGGVAFLNIPINEEHFADPRHVRKYKPDEFIKQLENHGYKVLFAYQGDKLWNTFGWFFEKDYHNKIPILGFVISSVINVFFSAWPFSFQIWFEERFLKQLKPRQFAVCATK